MEQLKTRHIERIVSGGGFNYFMSIRRGEASNFNKYITKGK